MQTENSQAADSSFCFSEQGGNGKGPHISVRSCKEAECEGRKKHERVKQQRASLSLCGMLFMLLTGLLTSLSSFCGLSLGAHFGFVVCVESAFSLYPVEQLHYL